MVAKDGIGGGTCDIGGDIGAERTSTSSETGRERYLHLYETGDVSRNTYMKVGRA